MKKIKLKIIPLIISLAIVIGSVSGIMLYSYYNYDNHKLNFVADYFHFEDYSSVQTEEQIENYVKMTTHAYQKISDGLTYFDVSSSKEYNETPSHNSQNFINDATFENGVLHLPGYFDLAMYAETSWSATSEEWIFSYYIYVYNVNYFEETIVNNLYFCFVNGIGESGEGEIYGLTKLNTVIEEVKKGENGTPNAINLPSYQYQGNKANSYVMYIRDNDATGNTVDKDAAPFVYRLTSLTESPSESSDLDNEEETGRWFSELDEVTFSILYTGTQGIDGVISNPQESNVTEIVRGTYQNPYEDAEDFNEKANKGYEKDVYKAGFFNYIIGRLIVEGLVTFVISGVLAVLFYLIWQDEPQDNEKPKQKAKKLKFKKEKKDA